MEKAFAFDQLDKVEKNITEGFVEKLRDRKRSLILFGAGEAGRWANRMLNNVGISPDFFCDNQPDKLGKTFLGVPILSFKEVSDHWRDSYIIITAPNYVEQIRTQLRDAGLCEFCEIGWLYYKLDFIENNQFSYQMIHEKKDLFARSYSYLSDEFSKKLFYDYINYRITGNSAYLLPLKSTSEQYFEEGLFRLSEKEIFVDGGAYEGDSAEVFLTKSNGKFKKIYAFEPDQRRQETFKRKHGENENIVLMPYGLWSKKDILGFQMNEESPAANRITGSENGDIQIPVLSIDEALQDEPVTFIKIDIEGAELEALKGAEQTIKKFRPKLAVCIYHKPLDILEIPLYIKSIVPDYQLYLRHYSDYYSETVLYAIAE